ALRMLEAGEADIQAVDAAMLAGGYPIGPFALIDLVGVDANLAVARTLFEGFDEAERFRPSPIQERLVAAGTLGRKSGRGFYRYDEDGGLLGPAEGFGTPDPTTADEGTPALDAGSIQARIELSVINEAYR